MRLGFAVLLVALLSSCGFSPSTSDVERALTRGDPLNGKVYQIGNVHRKNGYEREGQYVVEYTAELQILENPTAYFGRLAKEDQSGLGTLAAVGMVTGGLARWGLVTVAAISAAKKGDVVPFSGTITMIKSEQGWIPRPQ